MKHKETKTTLLFTKLDPDFVRDLHVQSGVLRGVVSRKASQAMKKRRLV